MVWVEQKTRLEAIVRQAIADDHLHSRLLNSISLMEHTGAAKISGYQKLGKVSTEVLRHAFEESRHAYFFRSQINKLAVSVPNDYGQASLLAPLASRQYLKKLDLQVCRYLKHHGYFQDFSKGADLAYGYTTLLIELRAERVYRLYQNLLEEAKSAISVRSIVAEEDRHLQETEAGLVALLGQEEYRRVLRALQNCEEELFEIWLTAAARDLNRTAELLLKYPTQRNQDPYLNL